MLDLYFGLVKKATLFLNQEKRWVLAFLQMWGKTHFIAP
jgi:hypothetical protein